MVSFHNTEFNRNFTTNLGTWFHFSSLYLALYLMLRLLCKTYWKFMQLPLLSMHLSVTTVPRCHYTWQNSPFLWIQSILLTEDDKEVYCHLLRGCFPKVWSHSSYVKAGRHSIQGQMKYKPVLYNNNSIKTEAGEKKNKTEQHQKKPHWKTDMGLKILQA